MGKGVKVSPRKPRRRTFYTVGDRFERPGYDPHMLCQIGYRETKLINILSGNRFNDMIVCCLNNIVDPNELYRAWGKWTRYDKAARS